MHKIFQANIGTRLAASFALVLLLTVVIAAAGVWRLNEVDQQTHEAMVKPMAKERLIAAWYRQVYAAVRRTAAIVKSNDPALSEYFKEDSAATARQSEQLLERITPLMVEPEEKKIFEMLLTHRLKYTAARDAAVKAKADGDHALSEQILAQQFTPAAETYQKHLDSLLKIQMEKVNGGAAQIDTTVARSSIIISLLTLLALVIGALSAWLIARSITRPLHQAVTLAEGIAQGDLTQRVDTTSTDETGMLLRALERMNTSLARIVDDVRGGTHEINAAAGDVANGSLELSARTEQQAAALEETAASMEQLTSSARHNADNANQANELAGAASRQALDAGAAVEQVVATMRSIDASSHQIVDIISVIDGIAFQTNILALNAAVEAARAGEQGRGFAVVASEVRNLAQRSSAAAKEIKQLIDSSVEQVETGAKQVNRTGDTMRAVVTAIGRVAELMNEISASSREQIHGIDQVNVAMQQMDQTTQQNAALVEESSAATSAMQQQAAQLSTSVAVFRVNQQQQLARY